MQELCQSSEMSKLTALFSKVKDKSTSLQLCWKFCVYFCAAEATVGLALSHADTLHAARAHLLGFGPSSLHILLPSRLYSFFAPLPLPFPLCPPPPCYINPTQFPGSVVREPLGCVFVCVPLASSFFFFHWVLQPSRNSLSGACPPPP